MKILIVKTSAIGDVIQTFFVLEYLKKKIPNVSIDWVVSKKAFSIVKRHPFVKKAILFKKSFFQKELRKEEYDIVFDFQGNLKSSIATFFAKGKDKVGFSFEIASESINCFFTNKRFSVDRYKNIRYQYVDIVRGYFKDQKEFIGGDVVLKVEDVEKKKVDDILKNIKGKKILIAPHSKWKNKDLDNDRLFFFLLCIEKKIDVTFIFPFDSRFDFKKFKNLKDSVFLDKLSLIEIYYLMQNIDSFIGMDSSLLHLFSLTTKPSFAFFGPTSSFVYSPNSCEFLQGECKYNQKFIKRCKLLRKCKRPMCLLFSEKELQNGVNSFLKKLYFSGNSAFRS